jgi:hypothetical protein
MMNFVQMPPESKLLSRADHVLLCSGAVAERLRYAYKSQSTKGF